MPTTKIYIAGYPKTQAEMEEWRKKYKFDPTAKKWYIPETPSVSPKIREIGKKIEEIKLKTKEIGKEVERISADKIKETIELPEIPDELSKPKDALESVDKIKSTTSVYTSYVQGLIERHKEIMKRLEETEKERKSFLEKLTAKPEKTREEKLEELRKEYGIPEKIEEIEKQAMKVAKLQEEIERLDLQRRQEIEAQYQRRVAMPVIESAVREINREYSFKRAKLAVELGAQAAVLEALQGNLETARNLIRESISAYMYDIEEERRRYEAFFDYYSDVYESLEREEREIIDQAYQTLLQREQEIKAEKEQVGELMIQYPNAGITVDDSLDEARRKVAEWLRMQPEEEEIPEEDLTIKRRIISEINSAVDQYRLNPEGFREKFIESLVSTYGEKYRDYITKQVYTLMPDIKTTTESVLGFPIVGTEEEAITDIIAQVLCEEQGGTWNPETRTCER